MALVVPVVSTPCQAADAKKLELKCIDTQGPADQVYIKFYVDGKHVPFSRKAAQKGTHEKNTYRMNTKGVLIFNAETLKRLTFSKTLRIIVMEDDPVVDDTLGDITIKRSTTSRKTFSGKQDKVYDYTYELIWETT